MAQSQPITEDTAHTLLTNSRRRCLLAHLKQTGRESVEELSLQIAAHERDVHPTNVSEETKQRVIVSLVHTHIPLLADHNIIEYKPESNDVILMDVIDELSPHLKDRSQATDKSVLQKLISIY